LQALGFQVCLAHTLLWNYVSNAFTRSLRLYYLLPSLFVN
jgi:hypothetical protein